MNSTLPETVYSKAYEMHKDSACSGLSRIAIEYEKRTVLSPISELLIKQDVHKRKRLFEILSQNNSNVKTSLAWMGGIQRKIEFSAVDNNVDDGVKKDDSTKYSKGRYSFKRVPEYSGYKLIRKGTPRKRRPLGTRDVNTYSANVCL